MVFDFAARPPEVNSTLIYSGAGAGPMMAAATSFSSPELGAGHECRRLRIGDLAAHRRGLAGPVVDRNGRRGSAEHRVAEHHVGATAGGRRESHRVGGCIRGGVCRLDSAAVVYANRAQLAALVATNILGQNTPAIAANEAMYGEFWAQDATALTTYAANAANRRAGDPVDRADPEHQPGWLGRASRRGQQSVNSNAANSGLNGLLGNLQNSASSLATPAASTAATTPLGDLYSAVQGFFGVGAVTTTR